MPARRTHLAIVLTRARLENTLLSQQEFADRYGFSERGLRGWEAGEHIPNPAALRKYAEFFDLDELELGRLRELALETRRRRREARQKKDKHLRVVEEGGL